MTISLRAFLYASAALLLAPATGFAQEVKVAPRGIQSAPAGAVKGKAADAAASTLPPGGPPVTAAQASQTEAQLAAWLATVFGPAVKLDRPVQLSPAGDHFDILAPIPLGPGQGGLRITGTARPLDAGKWAVAGLHAMLPATFTISMPIPDKDADPKKAPALVPITYKVTAASQDGGGVIDTTFATPSTWTTSAKDVEVTAEGPLSQTSHIKATNSVTSLVPAGADRLDVRTEGTMTGYSMASAAKADQPAIKVSMDTIRVNATLDGVSRSRSLSLTQATAALMTKVLQTPTGQVPDVPPQMVLAMLSALQDFASSMAIDESFEGLSVAFGDYEMTLDEAKLGMAAKTPDGLLQATMDIGAAGLELPNLPLGGMEELIPQRIALRPFVGGVAVADLSKIANTFSAGKEPSPEQLAALFSHGGVVSGLESMLLEVGGATFTGQAKLTVTSPDAMKGAGQITVENFDTLFKKVSGMPMLAQGVPVMIFLKGIGKTVNNKLVYDISFDGAKMLVNDVDLMAMAGGGGGPPAEGPKKAPVRPRPQQQQTPQNRTR